MTATDCSAIYGRRLVTSVGGIGKDGCPPFAVFEGRDSTTTACIFGPDFAGFSQKPRAPLVRRGSENYQSARDLSNYPLQFLPTTLRCISIDTRTQVIDA